MQPEAEERPFLLIGKVGRPHGLLGEVAVSMVGDDPGRLAPGAEIVFARGTELPRRLRVAASRPHGRRLLVRFEGVEGRTEAELLGGGELSVRFDPADAGAGEYYAHQLEGLEVVTSAGERVGHVAGVVFAPGRPFLEVSAVGRAAALLVPFHADIVKEVDLAGGRLTIDPPAGLLDL